MKKLVLLVFLLFSQPLAGQQVVSVQSGDHEGFSRLVLRTDPSADWEVIETPGRAELRFSGQEMGFSTGRVFDRISQDRITSVAGENGDGDSSLILELACKCEVKSFAFEARYIVLDIYDGPELDPVDLVEAENQWQPDALPFVQPPPGQAQVTTYAMTESPAQPILLPDPIPARESVESEPDMVTLETPEPPDTVAAFEDMAGAVIGDMASDLEAPDDPEMLARIEEAQNQLLAQLTLAADQGLVEFVPKPVEVAEAPAPEPEPLEETPEAPMVVDQGLLQQLSVRTAYEHATEDALAEIVNQFAMPQCLEDEEFLMESWSDGSGFSNQLAALRSQLLGEFDEPDVEVTEDIVQLYLRFGLGAEARLVLSEAEIEVERSEIYLDLANILENEPENVEGAILLGAGCGGAHEMWHLSAGLGDYQIIDPLAITDIFSVYPIEVRTLIGPPLAEAFIRRGQVEAGHLVLEIVRRAEGEVTIAQQLAEARVLEAQADTIAATDIYRKLAKSNDTLAPEALIAYARLLLASGKPVPASLLVDLEGSAFFYRNTERSDPLRLWEIRTRAAVEGDVFALRQIAETKDERPHLLSELQHVAAEIFEQSSAAKLGDYAYAEMVFEYAALLDQGASGDTARLKIAQEMMDIGLPETALDVLSPNLERPVTETEIIVAAAHVQLFQPEEALALLAGQDSLAAFKIRLSANLQMEDYAAVARMLEQDFAKDITIEDIALRAGDWENIGSSGPLAMLARYISQNSDQLPSGTEEEMGHLEIEENPSLRGTRELLAVNRESRSVLEDVLAGGGQP